MSWTEALLRATCTPISCWLPWTKGQGSAFDLGPGYQGDVEYIPGHPQGASLVTEALQERMRPCHACVEPHSTTCVSPAPRLREGSGKQLWQQSSEANTIWT